MLDPQTKIGAVTLNVADLSKMTAFYRDVIGLQVRTQSTDLITLGTATHSLIVLRFLRNGRFLSYTSGHTSDHTSDHTTGLYHLALRVPTRQDLANWLQHYATLDAPHWQGAADHGVSEALYLSDPEGNGIEVYWDRAKTEWPQSHDGKLTMYTRHLDVQALLNHAQSTHWAGMSFATDMGHIHLKVADIAAAKRFYVQTFGFNLVVELPGSALFVAAGDYHHHIGLNTWHSLQAPPAPKDAFGLARFEILFADKTALQNTVAHLKEANYPIQNGISTLVIRDPFNIEIALLKSHSNL